MENASSKVSDVEIVRRVIDGDINAFEHLLIKYKAHVIQILTRHLPYQVVEETAHEVFVKAYQSLPAFKNKTNFKQWLSTIAVRTCHDFWRKQYRSRELPMSSLTEKHQNWLQRVISHEATQTLSEKGRQKEARELLDWALAKISPDERMVLELVYLEGLSCKETAKLLGLSVANIKVRSFRSRNKLKKLLHEFMQG